MVLCSYDHHTFKFQGRIGTALLANNLTPGKCCSRSKVIARSCYSCPIFSKEN